VVGLNESHASHICGEIENPFTAVASLKAVLEISDNANLVINNYQWEPK
jgi:hypothetical protein